MSEQPEDKAGEEKPAQPATTSESSAKASDAETAAEPSEAQTAAQPGEAEPVEAAPEPKTSVQQSDEDDAVLDPNGRERPRFLLGFPQHPELQRLVAAFEAGNYALVRDEAGALAERAESSAVRDAALELRRRIEPDPLAKYLLALTGALLLFLTWFAYHH